MAIISLSAPQVQEKMQQGAVLIDIRSSDEYKREHIAQAQSIPLERLQNPTALAHIPNESNLIFHCKSGVRTQNAQTLFTNIAQQRHCQCFILEQGISGWKKAGLATQIDRKQPLEIMRQVQIAAGSMTLLGVLLGYLVSPYFYWLSGFIGAGLTFAGVTGFCGLARLLAKMPWNKS